MKIKTLVLFLFLNFLGLLIGGLFTETGAGSWYDGLNKAPWTPPGWVFGAAWTSIMVCFSFYMAQLVGKDKPTKIMLNLYVASWLLNVAWNPVFFYFHNAVLGMLVITTLLSTIAAMLFSFRKELKWKSALILPYIVWLGIATSLNIYVYLAN